MVLLGLGIGLAASLALTRVLGNLLYEVKPSDPLIFIAVFILLLGVALIAAFIPATGHAPVVIGLVAVGYAIVAAAYWLARGRGQVDSGSDGGTAIPSPAAQRSSS